MRKVITKDDEAVSPIIATILLVAITVVLAATLYTILGGYTSLLGATTPTASVEVQNSSAGDQAFYIVYVDQFSGNISLSSVDMRIIDANGSIYITHLIPDQTYNVANTWNITVKGGDYLGATTAMTISGRATASTDPYISEIQLIDTRTNGVISTTSVSP
ncbi:hypothetical protein GCM10007108_12800 [Thermogymnomonas acidicola]|uniref:Archaeal Type IV pilin N-terminal domain-containing protein n=1 Tax=Thermogymnomonas acidicola TaxID=399579 RepID=A0AA37BRW5_9ARCH|nr:archaellin/type IV pilin N-terminal domain-containing protein [Thermogymnomonas acidicola]GGM76276.1 hypothetical protein GCM10007108_12800 [Thermogymnomonas acidicola]